MVGEIQEQMPAREGGEREGEFPADVIVCSVGGGGLFSGIVLGLERFKREGGAKKDVDVVAVETKGADSLAYSIRRGQLSSLDAITSEAGSLGALRVAEKAYLNATSPPAGVKVSNLVGSDMDAARGILRLADETRLQVELACGISVEMAVAGRLKEALPNLTPDSRVVVVVCGGSNISAEMIAEYRKRVEAGWTL